MLRCSLALVTALLVLPALSAGRALAADPIPFEIGIAGREAGHLRALFEKLSKQNVLFQFHLGGVTKQEMQETTAQIDRVMTTLEKGSPAYSVAPPVTKAVRDQLRVLDGRWGLLRRLALASPYDYLRFGSDIMPKQSRLGDPLSIQIFDDMAADAIAEADTLLVMIIAECNETGYEFCDAAGQSGFFNMHIERIAKQLVLVYARIDPDTNLAGLAENSQRLDASLAALGSSPILTGALSPSRGRSAAFASGLWDSIQAGWARVRFDANLAVEGHVDGLEIQRMLKAQRNLVDDLDRFRAALSRYAEALVEA